MSASNRSVLTSTDNCDDEAAWPHQLFDMRVVGGAGRGEGWPCGGITKYHQLYTSWKLSRQSQCFVSTGRTVTGDNDKEAPGRDLYFPQTEHNIGDTVWRPRGGAHWLPACCRCQAGLELVRAAVCWLLMKMLCDEQPGCGARGPAWPDLGSTGHPGPRPGNVQCVSHVTTCIHWTQHWQGFAHSPLLSALQTIIPGFCCQDICRIGPFLALACHHCCIQDTCCSVTPLTRTMPPP